MKKSRSNRIIGLLVSIVFALSLLALNSAGAADSSDKAEAGRYKLSFYTSFNMCEMYYHIQNSDGREISYGSVDELSTSVEGWKTYEREIWLEEAPAKIWFSGRCNAALPGSSELMPLSLNDTDPVEFKECSNVAISNYSTILNTDYDWGSYSIKRVKDETEDKTRVLSGDVLHNTVIRMKPSFGTGKALSIKHNGNNALRQNVVHLYNIGDSSRFRLTKADDDSYYIDFYDGSGHYKLHDKRFDIDDHDGYDNVGNKVHVVKGNREDMNKRWQFIQRSNGFYLVRNKASGLYWALEKSGNTNNGNPLVQKKLNDCHTWGMEILNCLDKGKKEKDLKEYDTWSYRESEDGSINSCNWMSHIPDSKIITDMSIPGSHDAGTAKTTTSLNYSAQCQQHTIEEQLNTGVRYFDIRIEEGDGELYITHGGIDCFFGDERLKFSTVMDWVDNFLEENPGETVILQIMIQGGGAKAERMTLDKMKNWDRVFRGKNLNGYPLMPELGDLRGKVMFISRLSEISGINQSMFQDGDKWFALDAQNWKEGINLSFDMTSWGRYHEIWTQDAYQMLGAYKWDWVNGSLFDESRNAVAERDANRKIGKKGMIVAYTSCTGPNPQDAARYIHERLIPNLHTRNGQTDPYLGFVCNDFIDEELSWEIYSKNFRGINVAIRGMTLDGKILSNELNYYFAPGSSVGESFANDKNKEVAKYFTKEGYEPLCYGGGIPMYLESRPDSFGGDWKAMSDAEVSMYSIPTGSGDYTFYVPLVKEGEKNAKVTFDVHGHGTEPEPVEVRKGSWLSDVPVLTAEGYTFGGWYLDSEYKKPFDESEQIYEDMTLHAKWTEGHKIKVEASFPGNIEKPGSITLLSNGHIPANPQPYVSEKETLNKGNGWTGKFNLDPNEYLRIRNQDELKYDWYLITDKGQLPLKVHKMSQDGLENYGNCVMIDFRDGHEWTNPGWTEKQWKTAYDSVANGTAVVKMLYSDHFHARMTWNSGPDLNYQYSDNAAVDPITGEPEIKNDSAPWENTMLDQGEAHEVVLEHREVGSGIETVWKTMETGKVYNHEREGTPAWTCAFDTPIVDKHENYRVRLKVNNRTERDFGSQYILPDEDGKEKTIYDSRDESANGETNVFSFVFRDPLQGIQKRPGHRRTFKVTYGEDDQGYFTVHNQRIGDFTAEVKWNLPGKYKSLKPKALELNLDLKEGSKWNTSEKQNLSEEKGWYARFTEGQWENVDNVKNNYRVMLGSSSDGDTVTLPVIDGEEEKQFEFTVKYDTKDGYHYVVSLTLNHIHGDKLEHVAKKDASCTEAGNIEYWHCTECDSYFDDAETKHEITKEDTITKATGHTWSPWIVTTEPTEEQEGTKTRKCEKCDVTETETVPFEYDLRKVDGKPATCTEEGNIEYWVYDKSGKIFMDSSGQFEIQEDDVIIPALGHDWSEWNKETKTIEGVVHHKDSRKCLRDGCGAEDVKEYADGHKHELELQAKIPATCSKTGIKEHYQCTVCGQLFEDKAGENAITDDGEDIPEANRKTSQEKLTLPVDPSAHKWGDGIVEKEPTCTEPGKQTCICMFNEAHHINKEIKPLGHKWDAGKETKKATETEEGVTTFTCEVCGDTRTEPIPKIDPSPTPTPSGDGKGKDGTPAGKGASADTVKKAIMNAAIDENTAGTKFAPLKLKSTKQTKNSVTITWTKVSGANKYVVYGNLCGKANKMKKIGTYTGKSKVVKKKAGKKLKKGKYYKFIIVALDKNNKVVSTSKVVHVATKGGKVGNHKKVTVKKSVVNKAKKLRNGKTLKLNAKTVKPSKLKVKIHRKVSYESSNTAIATVSKKGVVRGKKKGTCFIYAYAQNGVYKKVRITVK